MAYKKENFNQISYTLVRLKKLFSRNVTHLSLLNIRRLTDESR